MASSTNPAPGKSTTPPTAQADTAHALTTRFTRMVEQGGKTGRRAAINGAFLAMPDMAYGVLYLCDLGRSDFAKEHLADMEAVFDLVLKVNTIGDFCHRVGIFALQQVVSGCRNRAA